MTSIEISSTSLKPFYHRRAQQQDTFMKENRRLLEEVSAAQALIERQKQELESLRGPAMCSSMQPPTTSMKFGKDESQTSNVSIGISRGMSPPLLAEDEVVTAKVQRAITRAPVRKIWKWSTPFVPTTDRHCNWDETQSDDGTKSTCSLSLISAHNDEENDSLDDLFAIGDNETERLLEESPEQTFNCTQHLEISNTVSIDRLTESTGAQSDVTPKICNTTTNIEDGSVHHGKRYPRHHSATIHRDVQAKRFPSALQSSMVQRTEILFHPLATSLEVVEHCLRDALCREGTYTGSIDSQTLLPDGFGTMIYENEEFEGDWEQGYYHGQGKHTNAQGDVYEGPFHYGLKQGKENATMNFGDGRRFHGRFHADKMREGVLHFVDGSCYEGLLENDKRDGFGRYCFVNGDEYEGQWKDDLIHGRGRMDWSDATWYNGEWEYGIIQGIGTKVDTSGNIVHQGYFYGGKPVVLAEPVYEEDETVIVQCQATAQWRSLSK